jgi:modification methylase
LPLPSYAQRLCSGVSVPSVWAVDDLDGDSGLCRRGYVSETAEDSERVPPGIATCAVSFYSRPRSMVVDPDCGAGTVIVEAVRVGRHAVGLTSDASWWKVARANLSIGTLAGAWPDGPVLDRRLSGPFSPRWGRLEHRADLLLTAVRIPTGHDGPGPDSDLKVAVGLWAWMLRPGGYAVVVLPPHRSQDGSLVNVATTVFAAGVGAGLVPVDRCVAVSRTLRGPHWSVVVLRAPDMTEQGDVGADLPDGHWRAA